MIDKQKTEIVLYLIGVAQIILMVVICFGRVLLWGGRRNTSLLGTLIIVLVGLVIFIVWWLTYLGNIKLLPK